MAKAASMSRPGRKKGQTRARMRAEKQSSYHAVVLIGFDSVVPRKLGDNLGARVVAVVTAKKERTATTNYDRGQPFHKVIVLEKVLVRNEAEAARLKKALDRALLGEVARQNNAPARHAWRDVTGSWETAEERLIWWGELLSEASHEVRKTVRGFRTRQDEDRELAILRAIEGLRGN